MTNAACERTRHGARSPQRTHLAAVSPWWRWYSSTAVMCIGVPCRFGIGVPTVAAPFRRSKAVAVLAFQDGARARSGLRNGHGDPFPALSPTEHGQPTCATITQNRALVSGSARRSNVSNAA
jgi:hypothetical protein